MWAFIPPSALSDCAQSPVSPKRLRIAHKGVLSSNHLDVILTLLHGGKLITHSLQACVCVCVCKGEEKSVCLGSDNTLLMMVVSPLNTPLLPHHGCTHTHTHTHTHTYTHSGMVDIAVLDRCGWLQLASETTALYDTLPQWRASYGVPVNMG